jgi:hypothetical protein
MNADWPAYVYAATDRLFATTLGPEITVSAIAYAPKRTGDLARSIEFHLAVHSLIVAAHAPYAAYVELGTRPHAINAKGPWSLHNAETGQYFGRHVNHPGTRPEPYLRPALFQLRAAA